MPVVGITELKLDDSINDCDICIERFNIIRRDQNRIGGGVVYYVSNKICFNANCNSYKTENIFIELLILKQNQLLLE